MTAMTRFDIREDDIGWTVFDVWTGQPVVIAADPQTGLDSRQARALALTLSAEAAAGDRKLLQ